VTAWILRIFGVLLMLGALTVALSRAPDRPVESLVARWAPPPSDFVEINGQLVHLRDEGPHSDPEPLLLLHGTGSSLHTWEGWAHELKTRRRVITLDLPGFGLSGPFNGRYAGDDYSGDRYARFVLDLINALRLPHVALGGNSLGGEIAWRVASLAPERVSRLLLIDASGLTFKSRALPLGFLAARLPGLGRLSESLLPRALITQGLVAAYADPRRISDALVDRYFELTLREGNRRALRLRLRQADDDRADTPARLAALHQPTLILWGEQDRLTPPAAARDFERRIAGSQLTLLPGLGHMPQEEDPVRSLQPVKAFLGLR
jgi:pimeloyl-ACP methyl ester carboxylesterase